MHTQHYYFKGVCYCGEIEQKKITIGSMVSISDFSFVPNNWNPHSKNCYQVAKNNRYIVITEEGNLWGLRPCYIPDYLHTLDEFLPGVNFTTGKNKHPYFIGEHDHTGVYCPKFVVKLIE